MRPRWPALIGALALAAPQPAAAGQGSLRLMVRLCGGAAARVAIPLRKPRDAPDSPCSKACHLGGCRRRD